VERAAHLEAGRPHPALAGERDQALDAVHGAGRDHLAGGVVVGRPDALDLGAEALGLVVVQADEGGHRARPLLVRGLHRRAPLGHQAQRVRVPQAAAGHQGGELAQRVPERKPAGQALLRGRPPRRHRGGEQRRLADVRRHEALRGAREAHPRQVLAEDVVGLLERRPRRRGALGQLAPHAHLLGALAREEQGDHAGSPPSSGS
jgi:hypothetical protein